MINQDKPNLGVPQTDLLVGSGYSFLIGGGYKLIIGAANLLAGLTNTSKPGITPLWSASILPWQLPLPWLTNFTNINNTSRASSSITNFAKP